MKKTCMMMTALVLCLGLLAGCGQGSFAPAAPSSEVFAAPDLDAVESAASEPESISEPEPEEAAPAAPTKVEVNQEVLGLLMKSNEQIKAKTTGLVRSHFTEVGYPEVTVYLNDYEYPLFLRLNGSSKDVAEAEAAFYAAGGDDGDNRYIEGNIYTQVLWVECIYALNEIIHELLFVPGAELTRESIGECLGEELETNHRIGGQGNNMEFDTWDAIYVCDGYGYDITYAEEGGQQVPIGATVWKGGYDERPYIL